VKYTGLNGSSLLYETSRRLADRATAMVCASTCVPRQTSTTSGVLSLMARCRARFIRRVDGPTIVHFRSARPPSPSKKDDQRNGTTVWPRRCSALADASSKWFQSHAPARSHRNRRVNVIRSMKSFVGGGGAGGRRRRCFWPISRGANSRERGHQSSILIDVTRFPFQLRIA
jgi:hypothetical protein